MNVKRFPENETPIEVLSFPYSVQTRALNALVNNGINSIEKLSTIDFRHLLLKKGIGEKIYKEIKKAYQEYTKNNKISKFVPNEDDHFKNFSPFKESPKEKVEESNITLKSQTLLHEDTDITFEIDDGKVSLCTCSGHNKFEFKKSNANLTKEVFLDDYLKKFIEYNLNIENLGNKD